VGQLVGQSEAKSKLKPRARQLRNSMTEPELRLWQRLRNSQLDGFKFRRQIAVPPLVADFLCPAKALIVEVDGDTHNPEQDRRRDRLLALRGYTTIRFTNSDVTQNIDGVLIGIVEALRSLPDRWPHPNPSPEGEGL
jgi:very-short-patch-repair endonuclease